MKKRILSISVLTLLLSVAFAGVFMSSKRNQRLKNINDSNNIIMRITAEYDSIYDDSNTSELEKRSEVILIGTAERIDGAINYNEKLQEYIMTSTIGKIKVDEVIKTNDRLSENDTFDFIRIGGTISVAEYEKSLTPRQILRQGLSKLSQEEKENSYVTMAYEDDVEIEEGQQYLMYLQYDKTMNRYRIIGMQYGLLEYNELTHTVKNNETQKWEAIQYNV